MLAGLMWVCAEATLRFGFNLQQSEQTKISLVAPKQAAGLRLDRFLANALPQFSRSRIQQLIREDFVKLCGVRAWQRGLLRAGDDVDLTEPPPVKIDNQPENIPLLVLFEDR